MSSKARRARVMDSAVSIGAAEIRFRGAWLRAAGFVPGLTVKVEQTGQGVLELRILSPVDGQCVEMAAGGNL